MSVIRKLVKYFTFPLYDGKTGGHLNSLSVLITVKRKK